MKLICAFSALIFSAATQGATLTGKVTFKGTKPKVESIKMGSEPVCIKQNNGKVVLKEDVVVNSNGTLANVFVYVKEGVKGTFPAPTTPVVFDQRGCMYSPHIFGIQVGQPLQILNSDPLMHNVNSVGKQTSNKFNNGMPSTVKKLDKKFSKPEVMVKIKCDVHGWMLAYAGVLEHPFYSVTDTSGAFQIKDLPAGEYTLVAWHEKMGEQTSKVTMADTAAAVEFTYQ